MNNNNFKTIMLVALIALVAVVGVGYAGFQRELTINGSGTVKASSWSIKFANLSAENVTGKAKELTAPATNDKGTHIGDYAVQLSDPGDSISYTFDVVNEGTFNAEISSIAVNTPKCTGSGENATTDAANVCDNLSYTLTYLDDATYADGTPVAKGNVLNAGEGGTKRMKLTLTYSSNIAEDKLPKNDVAISNLDVTIVYAQK